jgi:hypothetical protein
MSLINDALKRAREAQHPSPPSGAQPLPPVEFSQRNGTGWLLMSAAILLLIAACFLIGLALFDHKSPAVAVATAPAAPMTSKADPAPAPAPAPAPTMSPEPAPVEVVVPPVTNAPPAVTVVSNPPPASVAMEQRLKIQGIIFNTGHPLAIVNGRTVSAGDRVGDFQVRQILRNRVIFLCADGTQKTLTIGE